MEDTIQLQKSQLVMKQQKNWISPHLLTNG